MHPFFSDNPHLHPDPDLFHPADSAAHAHMNFAHQNQMMDLESLIQSMQQETSAGAQAGGSGAGGMQLIEQQMRLAQLQQLQQLQNQIFQQQIELLSGNNAFNVPGMPSQGDRARDQQQQHQQQSQQYGLPTPVNSTELRATHPSDFVSPMILQQHHLPLPHPSLPLPGSSDSGMSSQQAHSMLSNYGAIPAHLIPPTPHSAPASVAFQNPHSHTQSSPYAMPSAGPGELDFGDISPLTSPWLGASGAGASQSFRTPSASGSMQSSSSHVQPPQQGHRKRTGGTTSSGDESAAAPRPPRKRPSPTSPIISATPTGAPKVQAPVPSRRASLRGTRSANSTPLFPPVNVGPSPGGRSRGGDMLADTPSPIDIHMPPPAHPPQPPLAASTSALASAATTPTSGVGMVPVTPASIMNIGRMGLGAMGDTSARNKPKKSGTAEKGKTPAGAPGQSPVLKAIRPAGAAVMNPVPSATQPVHLRKTSHKAAEQKRRDSLKTSFDDLRLLLPPIPLPSDDGFPDEPILPGAMPPRGPPKGNAEGPNRGVSKLQLLRCGNEFIRVLKARVERRDLEVELLRKEVGRLRLVVPEEERENEEVDLERDVDAIEKEVGGLFGIARRAMSSGPGDGEDGDEDGGE